MKTKLVARTTARNYSVLGERYPNCSPCLDAVEEATRVFPKTGHV